MENMIMDDTAIRQQLAFLRATLDIHGIDRVPDAVLLEGLNPVLGWLAQNPVPLPAPRMLRCKLLGHKWWRTPSVLGYAATQTCARCHLFTVTT